MHGAKSGYVDPVSSFISSHLKTLVHFCLSYPAHFPLHSLSVGQSDLLTACVRVQGHWPGWPVLPRLARLVSVLTRTRGDRGLKTVGEHPSQ